MGYEAPIREVGRIAGKRRKGGDGVWIKVATAPRCRRPKTRQVSTADGARMNNRQNSVPSL